MTLMIPDYCKHTMMDGRNSMSIIFQMELWMIICISLIGGDLVQFIIIIRLDALTYFIMSLNKINLPILERMILKFIFMSHAIMYQILLIIILQ